MKKIDYKNLKRFDMKEPPRRVKWFLKPIIKLLVRPAIKKYKPIIHKDIPENLKAPFILLCNHNAFLDFKIATTLLDKNPANYIVAIDGFIGREWLLRDVGCICKRKFTNDIRLVRQIKNCLDMGNVVVIYPEARYSLCGTTAVLPESLGKLLKLYKVPVVSLISHGHHINSPFWDTSHERSVDHTEEEYRLLFSEEELINLSIDEINERIVDRFQYDDFKWQKDNDIKISDKNRALGLHRVLYQCPSCMKEYKMTSFGSKLKCECCGKEWEMTELGELKALDGDTIFSHIPDWYEWQRENIKKEIENGTYSSGILNVKVDSLPNAKKFIHLGNGTLIHDMNGFKVQGIDPNGEPFEMIKEVSSMYSCHIEYQYLFKHGDCIDLNTLDDTWYIYPEGNNFSVTKMAIATEELYYKHLEKIGKKRKKGLA
ncbi:1-acyl-sn-glycerol-3-phosphate acyltransferase [bacterium]|nr:1-acyl-sn-glycerol-3-phosphate acyltransferase [bacterium]